MWLVTYLFLKHHGISIWGPYENVKWLRGGGLSFWKRARGALGGNRGLTLEHQLWSLPQQDLGDMIFENLILCITIIIAFFIKQSLSKNRFIFLVGQYHLYFCNVDWNSRRHVFQWGWNFHLSRWLWSSFPSYKFYTTIIS